MLKIDNSSSQNTAAGFERKPEKKIEEANILKLQGILKIIYFFTLHHNKNNNNT